MRQMEFLSLPIRCTEKDVTSLLWRSFQEMHDFSLIMRKNQETLIEKHPKN